MADRSVDTAAPAEARLLTELTARLHDGPLYSISVLHRETAALALASEGGAAFDVERLVQLAQLAESTLLRFRMVTGDLHKLIGVLAAKPPRRVERSNQRAVAAPKLRNVIK